MSTRPSSHTHHDPDPPDVCLCIRKPLRKSADSEPRHTRACRGYLAVICTVLAGTARLPQRSATIACPRPERGTEQSTLAKVSIRKQPDQTRATWRFPNSPTRDLPSHKGNRNSHPRKKVRPNSLHSWDAPSLNVAEHLGRTAARSPRQPPLSVAPIP